MTKQNPTHTNMPLENINRCDNDEISLIDLFNVLMCRKKIVFAIMIITLLIAIAYLWLAKPVYEGKAVIQVGQVGQVGQIEDLEKLKQRLKVEYPFIERIDNASNFVTIIMHAHTKIEVKRLLKKITDQLFQEHGIIYNTEIAGQQQLQQKKHKFLRKQIDDTHSQIAELSALINAVKSSEPAQAAILVLEKIKLMQSLLVLEEKATNFDFSISKIRSMPTRLIHKITITDNPITPKASLVVTASIVLGLMIGIFSVFITELIVRVK